MKSISILTPTWNRAKFLTKLFQSLQDQTFKDFEWVVGDDGSEDQTSNLISDFSKKAKFDISYISSSKRVGKSRIDNMLIDNSRGKYLLWCDSDDYFFSDSIERLFKGLKLIPEETKSNYFGVIAQNVDTKGTNQTFNKQVQIKKPIDLTFHDYKKINKGDGTILIDRAVLKGRRFLEVDFIITESSLWDGVFSTKRLILLPNIVKTMDRTADNSVSFGSKIQYSRGSVYSIAISESEENFKNKPFFHKIKILVNYWRYCIHGQLKFSYVFSLWNVTKKNYLSIFLIPLSFFVVFRDIILGKVEKTHIEFIAAKKSAKFHVKKYWK